MVPAVRSAATSASPFKASRPIKASRKKAKENKRKRRIAERRQTLIRILCACAQLAPCKARSSDGVPPRLSPKGNISSQRLSFRPGFLGRGLYGRYPPSPVPVQGCTSHPGHNAGRLMPRSSPGAFCNSARGHRTRSALRYASGGRPLREQEFVCY